LYILSAAVILTVYTRDSGSQEYTWEKFRLRYVQVTSS